MERRAIGMDSGLASRLRLLVDRLRESDQDVQETTYRKFMSSLDPFEVMDAEERLMENGLTQDDMMVLCDAHVRYMADVTETEEELLEMPGHPIHVLMEEHAHILMCVGKARESMLRISEGQAEGPDLERVRELPSFLKEAQKHFQREENILFPYMERHGITGPPARMWTEHEVLRRKEKEIATLIEAMPEGSDDTSGRLTCSVSQLLSLLNAHFHKENHVLFPQALDAIDALEWNEVSRQFDDIGHCSFIPHHAGMGFVTIVPHELKEDLQGEIVLPTGRFTAEEAEMLLNALPLEITYVGEDDRVRYFSTPAERLFVRTDAVIGRHVQNCHPSKSVHLVQKVVGDLRSGKRDKAEFWIDMEGRKVHIRFFPLRDREGKYRGVVEVVQDITSMRGLEGERRLLDEE